MKEIGGYFELEQFHGHMLHGDGLKFDCARSCLAYLILTKNIKKIAIPAFMCDSVFELCKKTNVHLRYYQVNTDFHPENIYLEDDEYLYLMNYYGQIEKETIKSYKNTYHRIILDNTQAYFEEPISGVDTIYSCRKFFGVPDGGILYSDNLIDTEYKPVESFQYMEHLLGRFERTASEFYSKYRVNEERLTGVPINKMSKLSENLLNAIDYKYVKETRTSNFNYLHDKLSEINNYQVKKVAGAFSYPLLIHNAQKLRKKIIEKKIYIPLLWPNVVENPVFPTDKEFVESILPIPCDQRYGNSEMIEICNAIKDAISLV